MKNKKRIAIVTDTILKYGGAEKVLSGLLKIFPESDLYTLFIVPAAKRDIKRNFPRVKISCSFFQNFVRTNRVSKYISAIKFFSWAYWEFLDLSKYDLVISSSHSYSSKNVKKRKGSFHLSYIHTPPRYLYQEFCELSFIRKFPIKFILWPFLKILRYLDYIGSERPDKILVNSVNVKDRVAKYYSRNSEVIYPPVDIISIMPREKKDYYVCLSRLVRQKGIDLAVKTCSRYNLPLVVIGNGDELKNLKENSGKSIRFLTDCHEREKYEILAGAKALIYPSIEEDFGIVPVEALKCGTPVIAFDSGGTRESVADGINGVFFKRHSCVSLKKAMDRLDKLKIRPDDCIASARKFGLKKFKKEFIEAIPEEYRP